MSAFMCSDAHIDLLAAYACKTRPRESNTLYPDNESARAEAEVIFGNAHPNLAGREALVANILHRANADSVEGRYPDCVESGDMGTQDGYTYTPLDASNADPKLIVKAVRCYNYQSCEVDTWPDSLARTIAEHARNLAVEALTAGCDVWGVDAEHVKHLRYGRKIARAT